LSFDRDCTMNNRNDLLPIQSLTESIGRDPTNVSAYFDRGEIYIKQGQYDLAIKDFAEAIRFYPFPTGGYAHAYYLRGNSYLMTDQYDLAIKNYTEAIRLDPEDIVAHDHRGLACHNNEQYGLAIEDFTAVIRLDPANAPAYFSRGFVYYSDGRYDLATHDLEKLSASILIMHLREMYWRNCKRIRSG